LKPQIKKVSFRVASSVA